jgi:hypothetical protein
VHRVQSGHYPVGHDSPSSRPTGILFSEPGRTGAPRTSALRRSRKFALLGRCIESSMVPSFTGGSLGKEEKVETHLAQLD